jgi:serine protease AprX
VSLRSVARALARARGWTKGAVALGAALSVVAGGPVAEAKGGGKNREGKLDKHLRERLERQGEFDGEPVKVIVTMRPGARKGRLKKLAAQGASVSDDFTVIDASAARVPLNKLRRLEEDQDVLSISVDADVQADGIATAVTGTAQNSGYSLRSTLGLRAASATATTKSFQQGNSVAYSGTVDGGVNSGAASTNYGTATSVKVEVSSSAKRGMLVRFDNLFGLGAGQIPPGSTITAATLRVVTVSDGSTVGATSLHRMLSAWGPSSTWSSLATSGAGLQLDNVEASATADASVSATTTGGNFTFSGAGLKASVQAWANGQPNNGWAVWHPLDDGWIVRTSEDATLANRPQLTVTYKAPVNTTTLTGNGVTVAVIDSGMLEDGGGTSRIKTTRDFTGGATNPSASTSPLDPYGHGTHVAGLIGGNKSEVEGVAPGVKFVSLRVLNSLGAGSTSHVINAIQWAIQNKTAQGIDVINLSLGHPVYEPAASDPLVQAVEAASRAGITVVVSAGNIGKNLLTGQVGYAGITSPGNAPSAITVGATRAMNTTTRTDDLMSDFSSRGPTWFDAFAKPDVVAPGQRLLSAAATTQTLYTFLPTERGPAYGGRAYLHLSGTSMAAGVVSGTVALMIEQAKMNFGVRPTSNALKAMLQQSAFPMTAANNQRYDVLTQGAGAVNAIGAAMLAGAVDPRVAVGGYWLTGSVPNTSTVDGQVISFGDNIVWGDNVLWGDSLNTHLTAWNDNIVWGDDDNIVWGDSLASQTADDNIVWGDNATWGDNIVWGDSYDILGATGDNIVWGDLDDNIVWGDGDDNIVWGDSTVEAAQ